MGAREDKLNFKEIYRGTKRTCKNRKITDYVDKTNNEMTRQESRLSLHRNFRHPCSNFVGK